MTKSRVQEIISDLNSSDTSAPATSTFVFLWSKGDNEILTNHIELGKAMHIKPRTVRSHLYELRDAGYISTHQRNNNYIIEILKFRH